MGAKQSAEMKLAIRLYQDEGKTTYQAAAIAGVYPSSLYKVLKKLRKPSRKKKVDRAV